MIHLNDLFWTVQGEGGNAGKRALFVRMPFCNLSCSWCDTEFNSYKEYSKTELSEYALSEPARFAVITGGEPSMHKHTPEVVTTLKRIGFSIAMESNGMFTPPDGIDWLCVSPKKDGQYKIESRAFFEAKEFKYVVDDGFDFSILDRHQPDNRLYWLSPEFNKMSESVSKILEYQKKRPQWRLNLQTHKWIGVK